MANQSSVFPIYLRAEYRNDGQGFARFQSDAQRAAMAAKREFEGVRTALDAALSRPRNTGGSLDLGVDELRRAAQAQQQIAAAAREVANATKAAATANGQFDASLSRSTRAAFELAAAEERVSAEMLQQVQALEAVQRELNQTASATDLVSQATRRGTTARGNVINSVRAERTAFTQLGQQLQDVGVQYQQGTNLLTIFTQQLPQASFALTGLADSADKTKARIGQFAQVLSGPVGGAIVIATALLGPLILKLFESGDAADESGRAQRGLTEVLADTTSSYEEVTKALNDYNRAQERSRDVTLLSLSAQAAQIAQNLRVAASVREKIKAELELFQAQVRAGPTGPGGQGQIGALAAASVLSGELAKQDAQIRSLQTSANETTIQVATEIARVQSDASAKIKLGFDVLRERATKSIKDVNELAERLTQLNRQEKAALDAERASSRSSRGRSGDAAARRRVREAEQLAKFGDRAAEQIQRINERFDEQPRLIDAAAQATRQLDGIIADLEKRKPLGFEDLMRNAQDAKRTVEEALLRPIQQIRQESEQRLAIEEALALGQFDRAAALQEIFRLEQQIGLLNEDQRAEIEDIVVAEQQRLRVLRDQQAVFNAQLDVLSTVRRDLTDLLSGRKVDFFKNFRQALRDLQGQRLFEAIFGQTFRDIENELQANTPQGRANKALADQTNKTTSTVSRLEQSLDGLSDAVSRTRDRLLSDFDNEFGAANDNGGFNPQATIVDTALNAIGQSGLKGITVEAKIARNSVIDLAARISRGIGDSIAAQFEGIIGPRFAELLGNTIGGFIAGKVTGGTTGGIIGALKGVVDSQKDENGELSKGLADLSETLGAAGQGAAVGSQVNAFGKLFGFRGSKSGSQIGGAIGGAAFGPIGALAGAIAGNIIGGLLRKTPRASATIGGIGGSLGITGVRGNKSTLRDQSSGLAGGVLDSIDNIARQLGASVDASKGSVSIGIRSGKFRLDTSGQGKTKTKRGAIDFGEDGEAAVRAAVLDLIQDGVITGLRAAESRLLKAAKDVESGLRDALTFRGVFDQLREIKDPVGFAVEQLNREFTGLIDLFKRAGASTEEFASLEELYNFRRADAIKEATDRVVGSLKQLLNDLKIGDSGLSLRDRRSNALGQFNALAGRVAAGDATAFDDFADISQQLLDIERQLFGSTQAYFDRFNQITALTEKAIADQTNVTGIGAGAPSPFADSTSIARTIEATSAEQVSILRAINDNLVTALTPGLRSVGGDGGGSGRGSLPAFIANF